MRTINNPAQGQRKSRAHERAWSGSGEEIGRQSLSTSVSSSSISIIGELYDRHMPAVTNLKGLVSLSESSDMAAVWISRRREWRCGAFRVEQLEMCDGSMFGNQKIG